MGKERYKFLNSIGQRLLKLRQHLRHSRPEMAARLKITVNAYGKNETGVNFPDLDSLHCLSVDFGVSMDWLLFGNEPMFIRERQKAVEMEKNAADMGKQFNDLKVEMEHLREQMSEKDNELLRLKDIAETVSNLTLEPDMQELVDRMKQDPLLRHKILTDFYRFVKENDVGEDKKKASSKMKEDAQKI
jgi:transcriptional regulator with XRE-family HTH domain